MATKTISSRFIVTALMDGVQAHGELVSTRSLTQAINPDTGAIAPDWRPVDSTTGQPSDTDSGVDDSACPRLYPLVQSGGTLYPPATIAWTYNGELLEFSYTGANQDLNSNAGFPKCFKRSTIAIPTGSGSIDVSCLVVRKNLAGMNYHDGALEVNEDNDIIGVSGTVAVGTATLGFDAQRTVRVTKDASAATLGEIILISGRNQLNSDTDSIILQGVLHTNVSQAQGTYGCYWEIPGQPGQWTQGTVTIDGVGYSNAIKVTGAQVTDYALVACHFRLTEQGEDLAVAYMGVDDVGDDDQMQFAFMVYEGGVPTAMTVNNANDATIKKDQSVIYAIWVGKKENPKDLQAGWTVDFRSYNAAAAVLASTVAADGKPYGTSGTPAAPSKRTMTIDGTALSVDTLILSFENLVAAGGNISTDVIAKSATT